jgi:hypothetical protein
MILNKLFPSLKSCCFLSSLKYCFLFISVFYRSSFPMKLNSDFQNRTEFGSLNLSNSEVLLWTVNLLDFKYSWIVSRNQKYSGDLRCLRVTNSIKKDLLCKRISLLNYYFIIVVLIEWMVAPACPEKIRYLKFQIHLLKFCMENLLLMAISKLYTLYLSWFDY